LSEETALTIILQILLTLDYIHKRGIILGKITLDDILINNTYNETQDVEVIIRDLSQAHILNSLKEKNNKFFSSPSFNEKLYQ